MYGTIQLASRYRTTRARKGMPGPTLRVVVSMHDDGSGNVTLYAEDPASKGVRDRGRVGLVREDFEALRAFLDEQLKAK